MRLFVAVPLPAAFGDELRGALRDVQNAFEPLGKLRWTPPSHLHFTLKFLGECADTTLGPLRERLRAALAGALAFSVEMHGLGRFPSRGRPQVLWMGTPDVTMGALAQRLDAACQALGFEPELRPFHAHLTLARFDTSTKPRPFDVTLARFADIPFGRFEARSVVLMRSRLEKTGSVYSVEEEMFLAGGSSGEAPLRRPT